MATTGAAAFLFFWRGLGQWLGTGPYWDFCYPDLVIGIDHLTVGGSACQANRAACALGHLDEPRVPRQQEPQDRLR